MLPTSDSLKSLEDSIPNEILNLKTADFYKELMSENLKNRKSEANLIAKKLITLYYSKFIFDASSNGKDAMIIHLTSDILLEVLNTNISNNLIAMVVEEMKLIFAQYKFKYNSNLELKGHGFLLIWG
jgi:hypothetical protein